MKVHLCLLSLFFFSLAFFSCSENKAPENKSPVKKQASAADFNCMIDSLETKLFKDPYSAANRGIAMSLMRVYDDFSRFYPGDSLAPEYLFKAAELATSIQVPASAVAYYQKIEEKYPKFRKRDQCIFLQGFVYESLMNDTANAARQYRRLIAEFPQSPFVKDAEASILNLGKTPEELIREFERRQKGA
jgi:outer membrane protein assembly factor BamD (BamD/ComL family)